LRLDQQIVVFYDNNDLESKGGYTLEHRARAEQLT
jgi:hypothetical protein